MAEVANELMCERLKKVPQRLDTRDHSMLELRNDNLLIRGQVHNLQGDVNGLRSSMATVEASLDRIENRLELRELAEAQARFEPHP